MDSVDVVGVEAAGGASGLRLQVCDPAALTEWEMASIAVLYQQMYDERWAPFDATTPETEVRRLRATRYPPDAKFWIAADDGDRPAGIALAVPTPGVTPSRMMLVLYVSPALRGTGLGVRLLREAAAHARRLGSEVYEAVTSSRAPAGHEWARRFGGRADAEACVQQLRIAAVDRAALRASIAAEALALGVTLTTTCGGYEEQHLAGAARLRDALKESWGRGGQTDPGAAELRAAAARLASRGIELWTTCAIDAATGEVVGLSDGTWNAEVPGTFEQIATAVAESHRHRGLNRLLKAALVTTVHEARPSVQFARLTEKRDALAARETNARIGYEPQFEFTRWHIDAAAVDRYLHAR